MAQSLPHQDENSATIQFENQKINAGKNNQGSGILIPETVPWPASEITQKETKTSKIMPVGLMDGVGESATRGAAMGLALVLLYSLFSLFKKFYIQLELHEFVHSFRGRLFISLNIIWIALTCFIRFGFDPHWMQVLFRDHEERFYYILLAPVLFVSISTFLWVWTVRGKGKGKG
jgi:hypothetical protein